MRMRPHVTPTIVSLALLLVVSAAVCQTDGPALVQVGRTASPPALDGSFDDEAWQDAAVLMPFLLNGGTALPTQQTEVRICWDDAALYLAVTCFERSLEPMTQQLHLLKQEATEHDGGVFGDESVEIFLQPGASGDYYQLAANMLGTRYESRGMDSGFDADWQTAASADTRAWYLEVAIPFAGFGRQTPAAGEEWALNICRNQNPNDEHSTWSGLSGGFHQPEQFGRMVFADSTVQVRLADASDLSIAASALRLRLAGLAADAAAELLLKADREVRRGASVTAGATEVALEYPVLVTQAPPEVRYRLALADGTVLYRSPWFPQAAPGAELTGAITLTGGSGALTHSGRQIAALAAGEPAAVQTPLQSGENVLAITLTGAGAIGGGLHVGAQSFGFERGWRWAAEPEEGWDRPGFSAHNWEALPAPGADGTVTLPASDISLRRVVAVSDKRERFWPMETDLYLPRDSQMFVKPLLNWVGATPTDYVFCLDMPDPIRITALDGLDGAQLKLLGEERVEHDGEPFTRYRMTPIGTLTGGFTLELLWKNKANTQAQYVSALSLGGTFDWREFEIEVTSPPYAELVGVLPLKWQNRDISGECWFDDIFVGEKGSDVNIVPDSDFEGERWDDQPHIVTTERDGRPTRAVYLHGTEAQVGGQMGLWVSPPEIEVKPATRYVVRLRARGENIRSRHITGRASLLADVGSPGADTLTAYTHYEALDGHVVEVERAGTVHILPAMKRQAPEQVPIIVAYASSAYENPDMVAANAEMILDAGINWLWGSNRSATAELVRPDGVRFVWHIPRNGYDQSPIDREYLERHPDHKAVCRSGRVDDNQICPTIVLDTDNEFIPALQEWFARNIAENPYDMIDWDHEFPITYDNSVCLCDRCRTAFAEWAGLDAVPSPEAIFETHQDRWVDFRCRQNARMAVIIRDACKAAAPDIPFSVYSGYVTDRTKWLYGVDWALMRDAIDWGIAGYNGDRATVQHMLDTLDGLPVTSGCMYGGAQRFAAERPYPTPESWRIRLMRAMLDDEGNGFLVWYMPLLDGAGYWGIGWVSALVAEYEDFFLDFQRRDGLVESDPALDESRLAVLTHGDERLVIVINPGKAAETVELRLRNLPRDPRLVEYETGAEHDPTQPISLEIAPGDIRALHLSSR